MSDEQKQDKTTEASKSKKAKTEAKADAKADAQAETKAETTTESKPAGTDYVAMATKYGKITAKVVGKFASDLFNSAKKSVSEISDDLKKEQAADKKKADSSTEQDKK